eukprot:15447386-Alexandrium_andersonii.AAC.1
MGQGAASVRRGVDAEVKQEATAAARNARPDYAQAGVRMAAGHAVKCKVDAIPAHSALAHVDDAGDPVESHRTGTAIRIVRSQSKQSGVSHIVWDRQENAWNVKWKECGRTINQRFFVHRYMASSGRTYDEADAEALREAIAFRESMVAAGRLQACRPTPSRESGVAGVTWQASGGWWKVKLRIDGKKFAQRKFRPTDASPEAVEAARVLAVQCRRELEREIGLHRVVTEAVDPGQMVKLESGVPG